MKKSAWLRHLEGQPDHQLHQGVEHDVLHVDVDELIGEEPPGLLPSLWVVDEKGTDGSLACQDLLSDQARDIVTVPDVEYNLRKSRMDTIIIIRSTSYSNILAMSL